MRRLLFIMTISLSLWDVTCLFACTGIMVEDGDIVLVATNEDAIIPLSVEVRFEPPDEKRYGRVNFVYLDFQQGMNDQGLVFDYYATPTPAKVTASEDRETYEGELMNKALEDCATVEETLRFLDRYNLEYLNDESMQLFIADKTGDSAIIEGDNIIRKTGRYQIVTNFHQSKVTGGNFPCEWYRVGCNRYKTALEMLHASHDISVDKLRNILRATRQDWIPFKTVHSNIYDLAKCFVYVYYKRNFDKEVIIDLKSELVQGRHSYELSSLFEESK